MIPFPQRYGRCQWGLHPTLTTPHPEDLARRATRRRQSGRIAKGAQEAQRSTPPSPPEKHRSKYFAESSVPSKAPSTVFKRVNGANEIGKCVGLIDQHRNATGGQTFPNAHGPWQCNRDVVAPRIAGKCNRLALTGAVVAIRDETVRYHCSAEKLYGGVLQPGGQRGEPQSVRATR
jgi:hypothetical protein